MQLLKQVVKGMTLSLSVFILCNGLTYAPAASAHGDAKGVVKERMDRMVVMRKSMKSMGEMVKGKVPLDPAQMQAQSRRIQQANHGLPDTFPKDSLYKPSEALPAIWSDWERFVALTDDLDVETKKLETISAAGDPRAIKVQYVKVAEACRSCHADYRKKSEKSDKPMVITNINLDLPLITEPVTPSSHGMSMPANSVAMDGKSHAMPMENQPMHETAEAMHAAAEPMHANAARSATAAKLEQPQTMPMQAQAKAMHQAMDPVARGEYLFKLSGCASCHSVEGGEPLAGGLKMETPFGDFYTPNITPDRETGIGGWSEQEFIRALKEGISPSGEHYYPAFPYTSYSKMSDEELKDLKAYLDSVPAVRQQNQEHELGFPFDQRWLLTLWKTAFFDQSEFQPLASRSDAWNRGAYIVSGPGHCVECHTPRNLFGGLSSEELLFGNPDGPEGERVPPIHGGLGARFSAWAAEDIVFALETGMTPEGDAMGGSMAHVIKNTTSQLTSEDLKAVAEYLAQPL